ncbi:MAG: rhodanese-like domain-containing protein [Rhodospirillales bacterium]|jgi:rhodanese-related sulfurtransferase|nr:rhodanese-like domain-containing protein [Rhodospirillales bacterium]
MKRTFTFLSIIAVIFFTVLSFNASSATAAEEGYYTKIVDYTFIQPYAVIPARDDVTIIDSRPMKRRFNNGHIPGAISLPDSSFKKMTDMLPADKAAMLIFYCGGEKCMLSHKSAYKAGALGYTNIHVYAAGYPDWIAKGNLGSVSAAYVQNAIEKDKAVVVDARPAKRKYAKGHVPGAISIPNSNFDKLTHMLPADKQMQLVFYCGGMKCPLSVKSAYKALDLGYTDVKVFQGGYPEWVNAYGKGAMGLAPYEEANNSTGSAIAVGEDGDTITLASFSTIMANDRNSIHLIDVRDLSEFDTGSMQGAINIPVEELVDRVAELPTDKPIVFVCSTGARSGEAYDIVKLEKEEMAVFFLDAEITYHPDGNYELAANN